MKKTKVSKSIILIVLVCFALLLTACTTTKEAKEEEKVEEKTTEVVEETKEEVKEEETKEETKEEVKEEAEEEAIVAEDGTISYWVNFQNVDGTILQRTAVKAGETPKYNGNTPTYSDEDHAYSFKGWDKEFTKVEKTQTYTAQYDVTDLAIVKARKAAKAAVSEKASAANGELAALKYLPRCGETNTAYYQGLVAAELDAANQAIDAAETVDAVNAAKDACIANIDAIVAEAINIDLAQCKAECKDAIDEAAKAKVNAISNSNGDLLEKIDKTNQVSVVVGAGKATINSATTVADVESAKTTCIETINSIEITHID